LRQAPGKLQQDGVLLLEVNEAHAEAVAALARVTFPAGAVAVWPDLAGLPRVVDIRRGETRASAKPA
ncbi:MAG: hypothetical protein HY684_04190, partial [Chloroflexi bacterium]|nr:hypothetical protein [Chloroflexota bacterium]